MGNIVFANQNDFLQWIKTAPKSDIESYIKRWLKERQVTKRLCYSLGQVELRSLKMPGINYLNKLFSSYYDVCKDLQFINKYQDFVGWESKIKLDKKRKIFIDSREQSPLKFNETKTEVKCLKYGDYAFSDEEWTKKIVIERKSLADLIGTMFSGYQRFERELERAKEDNAHLIIVVEESLSNVMDYRNKRIVHYRVRIPPEVIMHQVRALIQKYPHIQFVFTHSREESADIIQKIFSLGSQIIRYDLQFLYDMGKFNI